MDVVFTPDPDIDIDSRPTFMLLSIYIINRIYEYVLLALQLLFDRDE